MKTLVLGASHKPERYSNLAVNMLREYEHEILAVGRRARKLDDWEIIAGKPLANDVDTVSLYLNPGNQVEYYDYILSLKPRRVIFNPGTENPAFEEMLKQADIEPVRACTLVMLRAGLF